MPVERRKRVVRHAQVTSRLDNRRFAVQQNAVSEVQVGSAVQASGNDILASLSESEQLNLRKKDKQAMRHEVLMRRLGATSTPYSKSHMKRLKRKVKGELSTDLASVGEAIAAVDAQRVSGRSLGQEVNNDQTHKPKPHLGQIGEGKHGSLTTNQRKRAFQVENLRHKLIMADRAFVSNPFHTIRTHAQNTLVKHQT